MKIFYRMPMRITALVLGALVLVPIVLLMSWLLPSMDRETIALIVALAMAASFAFPVMKPRRPKQKSD
ncbi:MAG TPA: hypothetical protein VNX61_15890 [Rhizomicrobium sp.]|nr:hypothetical protein [Rhizomicrobium sp.]